MPLFFIDTVRGDDVVTDPEGQELSNLEAARIEATLAARDLLCADLKTHAREEDRRLRIRDAGGQVLLELSVMEALRGTALDK